jgi:hypothetical protein
VIIRSIDNPNPNPPDNPSRPNYSSFLQQLQPLVQNPP